jgi:hypothetical protein
MEQCEREQRPDGCTPHGVCSKMTGLHYGSHQFTAKVRSEVRSKTPIRTASAFTKGDGPLCVHLSRCTCGSDRPHAAIGRMKASGRSKNGSGHQIRAK